jgi:hypothetical protein
MNKLLQIKPAKYLLIHFAVMTFSVIAFMIWAKLVPEDLISFGFTFIIIGFVGGYLFWLYLFLAGFKIIDLKNGLKSDLKKSKILLTTILVGYVAFVLIFMLDFSQENNDIPIVISILISPILTYAFFEIVIKLTKKFKYYDKKSKPNLWDYFITVFTLSFYPFGLLMMHSHLRLILKEQMIIEK